MEYVYFYKDDNVNIPIAHGSSEGFKCLDIKKELLEQLESNFPKCKNNLFALVDNCEFRISPSAFQLNSLKL